MPRNDRSDSLSVRGEDDPRNPMKALAQETELELGRSEANDTGGAEHRGPGAGEGRGDEPASARRGAKGAGGSSAGERSGRDPGAAPPRGAVPRRDE